MACRNFSSEVTSVIQTNAARRTSLTCIGVNQKRTVTRSLLAVIAFMTWVPLLAGAERMLKPNFIYINIDDLGYADIEPFGSKVNRTPQLRRMAEEGRKLTCFYAAPVCSPSRASLMTGSSGSARESILNAMYSRGDPSAVLW